MKPLLILIVVFSFNISFAHKTKVTEKTYNNIHIVIYTNEYTESINTALIASLYAEKLSEELGYKKKITLYFEENYFEENVVFAQIDKRKGKNELIVRFKIKDFNIPQSLNIIEYSILNVNALNKDVNFYKELYYKEQSSKLNELLNNKVYRPNVVKELEKSDLISYYFQNDDFNFYKRDNTEKIIFETFHLVDYNILTYDTVIIIESNSELKLLRNDSLKTLLLKDVADFYFPYNIKLLGNKIFFAKESIGWKTNRVAVYDISKDVLIQNIDELIK